MAKRIWIVNYYAEPPENDTNHRYYEFSKCFMANGWDVITFNASFLDNELAKEFAPGQIFLRRQYEGLDFIHVKSPRYAGNGLARMKSIFSFAWTIYKHRKDFERPDVILHNVHAPFDAPIVLIARKLKCKYISEVWDMWPDNFANFGMISRKNPIMKLFYCVEKWIYYNANERVFTLAGAKNYLEKKRWTTNTGGKIDLNSVHYINNGVNLDFFDKNRDRYVREDLDINDPTLLRIVYMGSINKANHVHTLIEAAKLLQNNDVYRFFIYGDGVDRVELEKKVLEEGINNVVFKEKRIPLREVAWIVSQSTVNIMNYQKGFGYLGVSSGKMFQYLAAGKPILCNIDIAYDNVIKDNNLGFAQDIDAPEDFAELIRRLAEQPRASYDAMCKRVRDTAKRFDYKMLALREMEVVESAMKG